MGEPLTLADLTGCFGGLVPAVLATVSAGGIPNVTYLSRAHPVDTERIAVSNQFLSKSSRNVAEEPRASLLLVRPETHEEYRLSVVYERTERQGPVFDRLRNDLSMVAALTGMEEVFRLSSADVYRVVRIEQVTHVPAGAPGAPETTHPGSPGLGELCERLSRCGDLDTMLSVLGVGLDDLFGYRHSQLLLLDEAGQGLFTIATHGYRTNGVGAETALGQGLAGTAAARCAPVVVANSSQLNKYSSTIRRSYEESGEAQPGGQIPMVGLARPGSQLAVPALALGHLVGVLVIEDEQGERFGPADAAMVTAIATILASTIETLRTEVRTSGAVGAGIGAGETAPRASSPPHLGAGSALRHRREHLRGRRLPHQGCGRPHPVVAAAPARGGGPHRVHQP